MISYPSLVQCTLWIVLIQWEYELFQNCKETIEIMTMRIRYADHCWKSSRIMCCLITWKKWARSTPRSSDYRDQEVHFKQCRPHSLACPAISALRNPRAAWRASTGWLESNRSFTPSHNAWTANYQEYDKVAFYSLTNWLTSSSLLVATISYSSLSTLRRCGSGTVGPSSWRTNIKWISKLHPARWLNCLLWARFLTVLRPVLASSDHQSAAELLLAYPEWSRECLASVWS